MLFSYKTANKIGLAQLRNSFEKFGRILCFLPVAQNDLGAMEPLIVLNGEKMVFWNNVSAFIGLFSLGIFAIKDCFIWDCFARTSL